jgi:hypothetical protein
VGKLTSPWASVDSLIAPAAMMVRVLASAMVAVPATVMLVLM